MIANGKNVAWEYQSGGFKFSQKGKILQCIGANLSATQALAGIDPLASPRQKKFNEFSSNDRYLISVKNEHGITVYYTPMVSMVDKQNPKAAKAFEKDFNATALGDNVVTAEAKTETTSAKATAPKATPTMKEVNAEVKAGRAPAMNSEFTMGNHTVYRICGFNDTGGFIGYRLTYSNYALKFLVSQAGLDWTYHSNVREAYSGYAHAADSKGEFLSDALSIPECQKFAASIEKQLKAMGFSTLNTDLMLSTLQRKYVKSDTRKAVTAVFKKK